MSLPNFSTCWLEALSHDRGSWALLSASILIAYGYALSNRRFLWNLLLVNAISGMCGIILQTSYKAVHIEEQFVNDYNRPCLNLYPKAQLQYILGVNEIFWYLNETSTVLYSFFKVESVTSVTLPRKVGLVLRGVLGLFCLAYLPLRIYVGYLRASRNSYMDDEIATAHGYAFIAWGLVEIVILGMLIQAAMYAKKGQQSVVSVISTICSSSILRLMIIGINQICIAAVSIIPGLLKIEQTEDLTNFNNVLWLIRGVYPMILLFDILSTQSLLVAQIIQNNSERSNNGYQTYEFPEDSGPTQLPIHPSNSRVPTKNV